MSVEIIDLRTVMPWDKTAVLGVGAKDVEGARAARGHAHRRLRRARSRRPIAEEAFEDLDAPRASGSRRPTRRCRSRRLLEKAFIPQVDDVVAGLRELAEY